MSTPYGTEKKPTDVPAGKNKDLGSWILIGILFIFAWPIGLLLLISKLRENRAAIQKGVVAGRLAAEKAKEKKEAGRAKAAMEKMTRTPAFSAKGAGLMKLLGIVLTIVGLLTTLYLGVSRSFYVTGTYPLWATYLKTLFFPVGLTAGGAALWIGGHRARKQMKRFGKYLTCAGQKQAIPIAFLARTVDVKPARAEKELDLMVEKGLWGTEAYVDNGNDMLFRSHAAASDWFAQRERPAAPVQTEEGYSGVLRSIRRANDRITDPVISTKITRLEELTARILKTVEEKPGSRAKASTFLNYYLPTTQKLLENFADIEETGVSGENLNMTRKRIADTMDNLVAGFEHQLDDLYRENAMDIDSDIRVMETMLRRDGVLPNEMDLGGMMAQDESME